MGFDKAAGGERVSRGKYRLRCPPSPTLITGRTCPLVSCSFQRKGRATVAFAEKMVGLSDWTAGLVGVVFLKKGRDD
jgi:hypothetical protein